MKKYPVVFSADYNYAYFVAVAIQSLVETTNADQFLDIYILYEKLKHKTIDLFHKLKNDRVSINLKKIDGSVFQATYEADYFTTAMYYRLAIPELLPEYEKVLYIDCDIILKKNIADLFDLDLSRCVMGAIYEYLDAGLEEYLKSIQYPHNRYFNSGVLLINCREFSKHRIAEKCLQELKKNAHYKYPDQDILNITCAGLVYPVETKWNFKPFYSYTKPSFSKQDLAQYEKDKVDPALIHYASGYKPWNYPDKYLSDVWWKTAKGMVNTFGVEGKKIYRTLRIRLMKRRFIMKLREIKGFIIH